MIATVTVTPNATMASNRSAAPSARGTPRPLSQATRGEATEATTPAVITGVTMTSVSVRTHTIPTRSAVTPTNSHAVSPMSRSQEGAAKTPVSSAASISTNSSVSTPGSPSRLRRRRRPRINRTLFVAPPRGLCPGGQSSFAPRLKGESRARGEDPHLRFRCQLGGGAGERPRRRLRIVAIPGVGREQGPPVDRDRDTGAKQAYSARGARGVQMARRHSRAPAGHGPGRHVHAAGQLAHLGKDVGVTREVHARGPLDEVAERGSPGAERIPASVVKSRDGLDADAAQGQAVARDHLDDLPDPVTAQDPTAALGGDDRAIAGDPSERGRV